MATLTEQERTHDVPQGSVARRAAPRSSRPALAGYAADQAAMIRSSEPGARQAESDAVHDMRVAARRLRATLRTFRPVLGGRREEPLRAELRWLGGLLGALRDAQVMADRLLTTARAEPPELMLGPVGARIRSHLAAAEGPARRDLVEALDSARFRQLLEQLDDLVASRLAVAVPSPTLRRLARRSVLRADRRLAAAGRHADPAVREVRLHEARKAYKDARYAVEAVGGQRRAARRLARRLTDLQDLLGSHQDSVVTRRLLRQLGIQAYLAGENGFSFGLLYARTQEQAIRELAGLGRLADRAMSSRRRRWLSR